MDVVSPYFTETFTVEGMKPSFEYLMKEGVRGAVLFNTEPYKNLIRLQTLYKVLRVNVVKLNKWLNIPNVLRFPLLVVTCYGGLRHV